MAKTSVTATAQQLPQNRPFVDHNRALGCGLNGGIAQKNAPSTFVPPVRETPLNLDNRQQIKGVGEPGCVSPRKAAASRRVIKGGSVVARANRPFFSSQAPICRMNYLSGVGFMLKCQDSQALIVKYMPIEKKNNPKRCKSIMNTQPASKKTTAQII